MACLNTANSCSQLDSGSLVLFVVLLSLLSGEGCAWGGSDQVLLLLLLALLLGWGGTCSAGTCGSTCSGTC